MQRIFITLISQQAIPNVQYILELGPFDKYYFLSTEKMERDDKSENIRRACNIPEERLSVLVVNEDNYLNIQQMIDLNIPINDLNQYVVNCTLGTKIMSIALFDWFKNITNCQLLYTPIDSNGYKSIINDNVNSKFAQKISIEKYFMSYGIKINKISTPSFTKIRSEKILPKFIEMDEGHFKALDYLRKFRDKGFKNYYIFKF